MPEQPSRLPDARRQLGRVDSFSDGLFAVAATLLALSAYLDPDWAMYCWLISPVASVGAGRVRRSKGV